MNKGAFGAFDLHKNRIKTNKIGINGAVLGPWWGMQLK